MGRVPYPLLLITTEAFMNRWTIAAMLVLILGLAPGAYAQTPSSGGDKTMEKMDKDKMDKDKMGKDKTGKAKMGKDKVGKDKTSKDKMMDKDKMDKDKEPEKK